MRHFIASFIFLIVTFLSFNTAQAVVKNDAYTRITNLLDSLENRQDSISLEDRIMPDDTTSAKSFRYLRAPQDSVAVDTTTSDSTQEAKPLFTDLITHDARDSIKLSVDGKKMYLYGDAVINYLTTELKAAYIELDMEKNLAFAKGIPDSTGKLIGKPVFKDGAQEFESNELKYNFETGKGFVKEIITQEGDGYIQGKLTKKMSDEVYCVKNGWYTTCDHHDHPHFYIRMSRAKMIKDKKVVSGFANLVIEDVPLPLFIPFGFFPISKTYSSGVIMPSYGEERMRGFNLRDGGYYWAASPYFDLAVIGSIYTNGSWALGLQSNYKKRYKFGGNVNLTMSKNFFSDKGLPDRSISDDWAIRWTHQQDPKANPYTTFSASVDISSASNNFFNETSSVDEIANQRKQSSISWSKKWPDKPFNLTASFNHNQNSQDSSITISFPNLNFRVSQIYPFRTKDHVGKLNWYHNIGFTYQAEVRNSVTAKEDELFSTPFSKYKNGFKHSVPLSTSINLFKDMSFSPSFNYTGYAYLSQIKKEWVPDTSLSAGGFVRTDTLSKFSYAHNYNASASLSYNPTVYGMYTFKPGSKVHQIRHVIRPSASVSYTPKMGVPRSRYYKTYIDGSGNEREYSIYEGQLYGTPSVPGEQTGSVSLSLDNNLEMKVRNDQDTTGENQFKKIKLLESVRLSSSYNIFADSLNWSNIQLSARTKVFNDRIDLNLSGTIDPYALDANARKINKFAGGVGRLTNLSFSTGIRFSADKGGEKREEKNEALQGYYDAYMDFEIPWTISIDYNLNYNRRYTANNEPGAVKPNSEGDLRQIVRVTGDFSLTPKWKFGYSTGFDFKENEVTSTSFNIARDLHCWEMTFSCIPFGTHQSYNFTINVRSSMLKDLKLTKRESFYGREPF